MSIVNRMLRRLSARRSWKDDGAEVAAVTKVTNPTIQYVETEFRDYVTNKFVFECAERNINVFCKELHFDIIPDVNTVVGDLLTTLGINYTVLSTSTSRAAFVSTVGIVSTRTTSNSTYVEVLGPQSLIDTISETLFATYREIINSVEWVISLDGNSVTIPLYAPTGVTNSSYPFIEEGVDHFIDAFLQSDENILLLIGEPGTGKSSFLKYLIARSKRNALITYDPEIMKRDSIFAQFWECDAQTLVLEDADAFLTARTEGNEYMSRFLNLGSGIISMPSKKLIFSTNLENLDDIDKAILRPGRLFAALHFRKLDFNESVTFCNDHTVTDWVPTPGEEYTLAELYNCTGRSRAGPTKRKVGFY